MKARPTASPRPAKPVDPLDWIGESRAQADILEAMVRQQKKRRRRRSLQAAAAVAVVFLAMLIWQRPWSGSAPVAHTSAVAHVPLRRVLPDGSVVEFKSGAAIRLDFSPATRRVELVQGEAHFQVTRNPDRPFVVVAGAVEVRAVGTAFSVDRGSAQVEVLVTEGRVALDQRVPNTAVQTLAFLDAGHGATIAEADSKPAVAEPVASAEIPERLAWRVPRLEFSGTPLAEAVPMINAHSPVKLVLADDSLRSLQISGVLRADNLETLRELLAETHGIKSEYRSANEIVLSRAR